MNEERRIEVEVEVPVSPEEAWEAIATGPGITAWFMPAEVEERVGGAVVYRPDADMSSEATVVAYDPPQRFAYEERSEDFAPPGGPPTMATEFLVEARSGGTSVVRVIMSGFGEGDAWESAIESYTSGWHQALESLRLYLTHFRGEPAASINAGELVRADEPLWPRFTAALGLPAQPTAGDRIATSGSGVPLLSGRVEAVRENMVTLLLDKPASGIGLIGVGGGGDEAFATVRAQLFGDEARAVAAREQGAWKEWLAEYFG